jgi:hypothetical protein
MKHCGVLKPKKLKQISDFITAKPHILSSLGSSVAQQDASIAQQGAS